MIRRQPFAFDTSALRRMNFEGALTVCRLPAIQSKTQDEVKYMRHKPYLTTNGPILRCQNHLRYVQLALWRCILGGGVMTRLKTYWILPASAFATTSKTVV